jgi:hypothetical protein
LQGGGVYVKTIGITARWEPPCLLCEAMAETDRKPALEVIPGSRDLLEAEIVEDLFLNRFDPAKAGRLKQRGRLTPVPAATEGCPDPSGPAIPRR